MGLGIQTTAMLPRQGFLRRLGGKADVLADVESACRSFAIAQGLEELWTFRRDGERLEGDLFAIEEPVELKVHEERLTLSGRTSTAGPGYHAHIVDLLDHLRRTVALEWTFDGEDIDETGYYQQRDFPGLQADMAEHHAAVARLLLKEAKDNTNDFIVSLPVGSGISSRGRFAATPVGYKDRQYFETVANSGSEQLRQLGSEWYPWWSRECDGAFWRKTGTVILWQHVPWRPSQTELERRAILTTLHCFATARELGSDQIPEREVAELAPLTSNSSEDFPKVSPDGIGYRRGLMSRPLTGHWTIKVPGYFYEDLEDDGSTAVYYYDWINVRGSSWEIKKKAGQPSKHLPSPQASKFQILSFNENGRSGVANLTTDSNGTLTLSGQVEDLNSLLVLTLSFSDRARLDEALAMVRSARLNRPNQD